MNDYQAKFVTPEQAVKAVQSGDWVDYGFGAGFPELMDRALAARKGRGEGREGPRRPGDPPAHRGRRDRTRSRRASPITAGTSATMSASSRTGGLVTFMPVMLRSLPYLYRDGHIRCDVAFVPVSRPDENGLLRPGHLQLRLADHL